MGQGMVIDPFILAEEINAVKNTGINLDGRLFISGNAHVILPYHREVDACKQLNNKIGTTKKGVGPCYEDKIARRGIKVRDLLAPGLTMKLADSIASWKHIIFDSDDDVVLPSCISKKIHVIRSTFGEFVHFDVPKLLNDYLDDGKNVLFEGAQGTLLDIDHGTYPFVTSSNSTAGNACTGSGVGPTRINQVIGITKAYVTRVGAGPFPTKIEGELADKLREKGGEYGSVTQRPRDVGWLDISALKHAKRVNGLTSLAVTKLDVLSGLKELFINTSTLGNGEVVYQAFEGWEEDIENVQRFNDLPLPAREYLNFIENAVEIPIELISVGPKKESTFERYYKVDFEQYLKQRREELFQEMKVKFPIDYEI
jgi:adenylosuccinate synthase